MREVGGKGQETLLKSRVLVIGSGGLGSPLLLYLAAAGIGTLGIVDDDKVDLSNLQRQILYNTTNIGEQKTESGKRAILAINPDIKVDTFTTRITKKNASELISQYDIIADGSDNFETRFLVNDTSYFLKKTY